jgi:capsular exopolysaccharide synthesis family protein
MWKGSVELRHYLSVVRRRIWTVLIVFGATCLVAGVATHFKQRLYTSSATIHVATGVSTLGGTVRTDDVVYLDRLENTYARLATGADMLARLKREVGLAYTPTVHIRGIPNTELMELSVTTSSPQRAAKSADVLAQLLIARVHAMSAEQAAQAEAAFEARVTRLTTTINAARVEYAALTAEPTTEQRRLKLEELKSTLHVQTARLVAEQQTYDSYRAAQDERTNAVSLAEDAVRPTAPSSPNVKLNLAIAVLLGLTGGLALAFVMENLSSRLNSRREISELVGVSVLGSIPTIKDKGALGLVKHDSPGDEAFRRLTATLLALQTRENFTTILVTSGRPGEGKSLTAINLGRSIAERNKRVVVVDADVRIPTLHRLAGIDNSIGLTDVVSRRTSFDTAVRRTDTVPDGLWILPSGTLVTPRERADPGHLFSRPEMLDTLRELSRLFDVVLIDSPAILAVSDALTIAQVADAALLVVSEDNAGREELEATYESLAAVDARIVGIVVNRSSDPVGYSRYYARYGQANLANLATLRFESSPKFGEEAS